MASSNTMKIQEVFQVTPFSDSTTKFSLPLTLYDTFWFNFPPVERLYFYQITGLTHHFFNSVILPNLKCSLSRTLLHYLPLAGNLIWPPDAPKPCIYYSSTDGGVSVTVAESTADFNSVSGNGVRAVAELHPLIPQLLTSDDKAALIAIQITLFPNQGFSIGITTHHAMFDGKSSTTFIKSWAYLCKQGKDQEENPSLSPELIPSFDRTISKDPAGIDMEYVNNWFSYTNSRSLKVLPNIIPNSDCVRATFELTREDIQKKRNRVLFMLNKDDEKEEDRAPEQLHLSTFLLTLAYVFVCMVKARRGEDNRSVIFAFTADYRTRLSPLVPLNYVGNCVMPHLCAATARDLTEENGIAFFANKLSAVVKGLERGELEGRKDTLSRVLIAMKAMLEGVQGLLVAGSTHFDVHGSDFGWGRPNKVEIVSIDRSGAVALAKSRDTSGGVEIGVALEKQEMEDFRSLFADGLKDNSVKPPLAVTCVVSISIILNH